MVKTRLGYVTTRRMCVKYLRGCVKYVRECVNTCLMTRICSEILFFSIFSHIDGIFLFERDTESYEGTA